MGVRDEKRGPRPAAEKKDAKAPESQKKMVWLQRGGRRARRGVFQGEIVGTGGPSLGDACCDGPGEAVGIWGDPGGGGGGVDDASIVTSGVSRRSAASCASMDRSLSASTIAAPVRASTTSKVSTAVRVICGSAPPTTVLILAPTTFSERVQGRDDAFQQPRAVWARSPIKWWSCSCLAPFF